MDIQKRVITYFLSTNVYLSIRKQLIWQLVSQFFYKFTLHVFNFLGISLENIVDRYR